MKSFTKSKRKDVKNLLGLSPEILVEDFTKKVFSDEDKVFLNATIDFKTFKSLNEALSDKAAASKMISLLLDFIIILENKIAKEIKSGKSADDFAESVYALCNTVQFICIFYEVQEDHSLLKKSLAQFEKHRENSTQFFSEVDTMLDVLNRMHVNHRDHYRILTFETIFQISDISLFNVFDFLGNNQRRIMCLGSPERITFRNGINFPYNFECLCNAIQSNRGKIIFDTLLQILEKIPLQINTDPEACQSIMTVILYVFKEFLYLFPVCDLIYLENAVKILQSFKSWPKPYSTNVNLVLTKITNEIKLPGYNFQTRMILENPLLSLKYENAVSAQILEALITFSKLQRSVCLFTDYNNSHCLFVKETLSKLFPPIENLFSLLKSQKVGLLYNLLENDIALKEGELLNIGFELMKSEDLDSFFSRAQSFVIKSQKINSLGMPCKLIREKFLIEFVTSISNKFIPVPVRYNEVTLATDGKGGGKDVIYKNAFSRKYLRNTIDLSIESTDVSLNKSQYVIGSASINVTPNDKFILYQESFEELHSLVYGALESHTIIKNNNKVGEIAYNEVFPERAKLKICSLGTDESFHKLLCSFVALHDEGDAENLSFKINKMPLIDVQVYILPCGGINTISEYIALRDIWYRRHVFLPLTDPTVFPYLEVPQNISTNGSFSSIDEVRGSNIVLNARLMHDYLRSASHASHFKIYSCKAWVNYNSENPSSSKNSFDLTIPFCIKAEIGVNVNVRKFQQHSFTTALNSNLNNISLETYSRDKVYRKAGAKDHPREDSDVINEIKWSDVIQDKEFWKQPNVGISPELVMKYTTINVNGEKMDYVINPPLAYGRISVSNTLDNVLTENNVTVDPTKAELTLYQLHNRSNYATLLNKREKKSKELYSSIFSEGTSCHISDVEIAVTSPSSRFHIMLDGDLFGPFQKIIISPTLTNDNEVDINRDYKKRHLTIPIMSFLPF